MAGVRVGVLGPLEVSVGGERIDVPGPLPRRLLALLAANGGRPVTVDALIDGLWPDNPPAAARQTLHSHVARLRRAIPQRRIEAVASGYRLVVQPSDVDAFAFMAAVEQARSTLAPAQRAAELQAALDLWRGPAYGEFVQSPPLAAQAARLEELRADVVQERWEALLCTDVAAPVSELEALVRTWPTREGLWVCLMHALYRAGRQGDALATFRRARGVLVAELGVEPGPALREMERRVLDQDPALLPAVPPSPAPAAADVAPSGLPTGWQERRLVVVLAVDIPVTGDDPEDTAAAAFETTERIAETARSFGAQVQASRAGAVLVFFGVPIAHEDDARRAMLAADAIMTQLAGMVPPRVGIAAGEVVVTAGRAGYEIVGRPVTDADALRMRASPGEVMVDTSVRALLGEESTESPFVGRDGDLALLHLMCTKAVAGADVEVIVVVGEAGLGKSRLVLELRRQLAADRTEVGGELCWLVGQCRPYGDASALAPLADLVRADCGVTPADDDASVVSRIAARLPDLAAQHRQLLATLLGVDGPERSDSHALTAAVREWLTHAATRQPIAVLLEDLHWASPALLDLLDALVTGVHGVPLVVVLTSRPELLDRRPGLVAGATGVRLRPLSDDDVARLLEPAGERAGELVRRSGGIPLYAEQLFSWSRHSEGEVPPTLRALLHARLDTLADGARRVLEVAAVAGPVVWADEVRGLAADLPGADPIGVDAALDVLVRRHFLRRAPRSRRPGHTELVFWHDLLRETAEARLPREIRAERHLAVACWWSDQQDAPAERIDHAATAAYDLAELAGNDELLRRSRPLACAAAFRAGRSLQGIDTATAVRQLRRALELCDDGQLRPHVQYWLGAALHDDRQFAAAAETLADALDALRRAEDPLAVDALLFLAATLFALGRSFAAVEEAARDLAERLPPSRAAVRNLAALAMMRLIAQTRQALPEAIDLADAAIMMADRRGCGGDALARVIRSRAQLSLGDGAALADLERGLDGLLREESGTIAVGARQWLAGALHHWRGPRAELAARRELEQIASERGLGFIVSTGLAEDVRVLCELGRYDDALALTEQALDAEEAQPRWAVVQRALALLDQGLLDEADVARVRQTPPADDDDLRHVLGVAIVVAGAALDRGAVEEAQRVLADLGDLQRFVDRDGAVELLPRLARTALRAGCVHLLGQLRDIDSVQTPLRSQIAATVEGLQWAGLGDLQRATALLRQAADAWSELGFVAEEAAVRGDLERLTASRARAT